MFNIRNFLLITFLAASTIVHSVEPRIPHAKIARVVKAYANAVGCFISMDTSNIVNYRIDGRDVYVALYDIDEECAGGSATHRPAFVALINDSLDKRILVLPQYSVPSATSEKLPQFIDRIFVKDGQLWYAGREFNWGTTKPEASDALCCPSLKIQGPVIFENGIWSDGRTK